ncbi:MAG: flagellin FliC3, partial [Lachnospiraceae bacterium]|nr:flagellin FliC3 [Lachnospiraceae bacterium]
LQRLGITGAEVTTEEKSADANVAIKGAIAYVSDVRSRLGAYQNRLEHTVSSLDITNENMTASYSRIMDVDVSEEMTYYTSQTVVEQAAISMLAQANERPSQVLQLLQ